jgi:hypothetical protein
MTKKEKLLDKAKNNPNGLSIDDFRTLLKHQGWILDHQRGSHEIGILLNHIGYLYRTEMEKQKVIR